MKGLMLKDFFCLKKQFLEFTIISIGVLIVGVLFYLSMEYGNMKTSVEEVKSNFSVTVENDTAKIQALSDMFSIAPLLMILTLPMALFSNIMLVFQDDEKAGFGHLTLSMPLSAYEIVGARFLVMLFYSLTSLLMSFVAVFIVSDTTGLIAVKDALGLCLNMYGIFLIYVCITMFITYCIRQKNTEYISIGVFLCGLIAFIIFFVNTLKKGEAAFQRDITPIMTDLLISVMNFLKEGYMITLSIACFTFLCSYFGSVLVLNKRKGAVL